MATGGTPLTSPQHAGGRPPSSRPAWPPSPLAWPAPSTEAGQQAPSPEAQGKPLGQRCPALCGGRGDQSVSSAQGGHGAQGHSKFCPPPSSTSRPWFPLLPLSLLSSGRARRRVRAPPEKPRKCTRPRERGLVLLRAGARPGSQGDGRWPQGWVAPYCLRPREVEGPKRASRGQGGRQHERDPPEPGVQGRPACPPRGLDISWRTQCCKKVTVEPWDTLWSRGGLQAGLWDDGSGGRVLEGWGSKVS